MTEHAGVVRDEAGLLSGLSELAEIEERLAHLGVHPDIAGFYDLAHAFDLKASAIAARATLESALERRETRGCHNRSDFPHLDEGLNVNLVWSGPGRIEREAIAGIPQDISARMREVIRPRQARRIGPRRPSWPRETVRSCLREVMPSLTKTFRRCHSTVWVLMNSCAPIS